MVATYHTRRDLGRSRKLSKMEDLKVRHPSFPTVNRGESLPPVQRRGFERHPRPGREGIPDLLEPPSPVCRERYPARGAVGLSERSMAVSASGVGL